MTRTERARFEAWQKKALAHEAAEGAGSLTLVFPRELAERIGQLAKRRHTTVKKLVQDAVYQLVA